MGFYSCIVNPNGFPMLKNFVKIFHCIVISNFVLITMRTKFTKFCPSALVKSASEVRCGKEFPTHKIASNFSLKDFERFRKSATSNLPNPGLMIEPIYCLELRGSILINCTELQVQVLRIPRPRNRGLF